MQYAATQVSSSTRAPTASSATSAPPSARPARRGKLQFGRAAKALRNLLADPNATDQVFIILEALEGRILERVAKGLRSDPVGRALLASPPALIQTLLDREALAQYGPNTLARAYLDFVESEGITADGLLEADVRRKHASSDEAFVQDWLRDTHDLKHALTGYRGDVIGELSLLAFDLAQHPSLGLLVIVAGGYARFGQVSRELAPAARRTVRQAFMRGLRASPLLHLDYVEALGRDVGALREELGLGSPPAYHPVRAHEVDMSF